MIIKENNKTEYKQGILEERIAKMDNPFGNITSGYLRSIQSSIQKINNLSSFSFNNDTFPSFGFNNDIYKTINGIAINSSISQLNKTIGLLGNSSLKYLNQQNKIFEDLSKNFNGLSASFLLQSQTITKETYNDKEKVIKAPIEQRQTISQTSSEIELSEVKNEIQKISSIESQNLLENGQKQDNKQDCQKLIWLSLSGEKLILNDIFVYHTFKRNANDNWSINERLMRHLIDSPNTEFSREELIEIGILNKGDDKDFRICLRDMKFEDDLARLFFDVSRDKIKLINPITPEIKKERGFSHISMPKSSKDIKGKATNSYNIRLLL